MKCPHCSKELSNPNLRFCSFCGKNIEVTETKLKSVSWEQATMEDDDNQPEWKKYLEQNQDTPQPEKIVRPSAERIPSAPKSTTPPPTPKPTNQEFDIRRTVNEVVTTLDKKLENVKYESSEIPSSIIPNKIHPCDGEKPVKQYTFMQMKLPIMRYFASGVLQITNKRIVYSLIGKSKYGSDNVHSEFAIDDVSGISFGKTTIFNFWSIIVYFLLFPVIYTIFGAIGMINEYLSFALALVGAVITYCFFKSKHSFWFHVCAAGFGDLCLMSFANSDFLSDIISDMILFGEVDLESVNFIQGLLLILFIYFFVMNIISYCRSIIKTNISLFVSSKSGMTSPIACSQNGKLSLSHNIIQSLCIIEPTKDTDIMACELGAMISDIQKLGDYGIDKWSKR